MRLFQALSLAGLAAMVSAAELTANTPAQAVYGEKAALTWTGGTAPYSVWIYSAGDQVGMISHVDTTSVQWCVSVQAGNPLEFLVQDANVEQSQSDAFPVEENQQTCPNLCTCGNDN